MQSHSFWSISHRHSYVKIIAHRMDVGGILSFFLIFLYHSILTPCARWEHILPLPGTSSPQLFREGGPHHLCPLSPVPSEAVGWQPARFLVLSSLFKVTFHQLASIILEIVLIPPCHLFPGSYFPRAVLWHRRGYTCRLWMTVRVADSALIHTSCACRVMESWGWEGPADSTRSRPTLVEPEPPPAF